MSQSHDETKPGMPHAGDRMARLLTVKIQELAPVKTQRQIAHEMGYSNANLISMFKRGESKVPLDKIPALARAIGVDPGFLLRMALQSYLPDLAKVIEETFAFPASPNEKAFIEWARERTDHTDPILLTPKMEESFHLLVASKVAPGSGRAAKRSGTER